MKKKVGFIGWRGMVGSVLLERMITEKDFNDIIPIFFTTSQLGLCNISLNGFLIKSLEDAYNVEILKEMDIIVTCQGSKYSELIYVQLRSMGWTGYWLDAASTLRMHKDSIIVLDPINSNQIFKSLELGYKTFVGSNCTVSLMLLALHGLFKKKLVEWISVSTYQAISGAGSSAVREFLMQMYSICLKYKNDFNHFNFSVLEMEKKIRSFTKSSNFLKSVLQVPLVTNLIPWIDSVMSNGQTREEWKAQAETNKILGYSIEDLKIDGNCVRINSLRCHSLSFLIKLNRELNISEIEEILLSYNEWVKLVVNDQDNTIHQLNPLAVSGTLDIPIGRLRKSNIGSKYLSAFSIGDQLLWGAAEPIRRMLKILRSY